MISIMHYNSVNRHSGCFNVPGKFFVISFVKIIKMWNYITIDVHQIPLDPCCDFSKDREY